MVLRHRAATAAPHCTCRRNEAKVTADQLQAINRLRLIAGAVSSVVHALSNDLQVIGGSAELLSPHSALGPTEHHRIETIGARTTRAALTLNQLTYFTRPDGAGHRPLDLGELVDVSLALRAYSLNCALISISVERKDAGSYRVSGDRHLILQVLLNLLMNAEAALGSGGQIRIRLERSARGCSVCIADSGPGLSREEWNRLVDQTTMPSVGPQLSGLGLWVSARISEQHRGRLDLEDAQGSGAAITLTLPAAG
jgi:signal transduction histidine kinase